VTYHARIGFRRCGTSLPQLSSGPLGGQFITITKMKSHFHRILLYATLYLIVVSHLAVSQPFGKIVGTIRDARTGELLLGETIVSLNPSGLGAMVDQKGSYVISQVPPGVYSICTVTFGYDFDTLFSIKLLPNTLDTVNFHLFRFGTRRAREDIAKGKVQIAVFGLTIRALPKDIEDKLSQKYGFTKNYNDFTNPLLDGYNETVYEYLDSLNGKGWSAKYEEERDSLIQQYRRNGNNH
jgi:hypothetical protein